MINLQPAEPIPMEGILDRLKNGREILRFLSSGLVSEALDIIALVPDGKYGEAIVDIADILTIVEMPEESAAVRALGVAMTPRPFDWEAIIPPMCKLEELLLLRMVRNWGKTPPVMMGRADVKDAPRDAMQRWTADNAAQLREARQWRAIRHVLEKRCPEVLRALDGQPPEMSLTPEQAEKLIKAIGIAIIGVTAFGAFWPPAAPACVLINVVLRAIQIGLKSKFPEINALPDFTPDGVERGLELIDLSVLA